MQPFATRNIPIPNSFEKRCTQISNKSTERKFLPNFGAGFYYNTTKWYAGLSIPNILEKEFDQSQRHYFAIAGALFEINRDIKLDKYTLLGEDVFKGNKCFLVEARSINPSSFGVRIFWIDKTYYLLRKIQYLNEDQENAKILEIFDYVKNNQYWTPTKKIMKNLLNGNSTEMKVIDIEYDQGVKDEFFSEKYLRRFQALNILFIYCLY